MTLDEQRLFEVQGGKRGDAREILTFYDRMERKCPNFTSVP